MAKDKLKGRVWFNLIVFGFMGQIAWNVENMYFNTFLYNSVYNGASQAAVDGALDVMNAISVMVAASAATAVITTFLIGILSDKLGRRKVFISAGYVLWGIVTAMFGFITRDNTASIFGLSNEITILTLTVAIVIVLDCVMTFVGSSANDAAFNAWVTDVTTVKNRATAESVLAILPIVAMIAVMALAGIVSSVGYPVFFYLLGGIVSVCGVIGIFSLKDSGDRVKKDLSYSKELVYGFRASVIKENKRLYLALTSVCIFSTAVQVFFPYIFIYLTNGLGLNLDSFIAGLTPKTIAAIGIGFAAVVALIVFMGKIIDKFGKDKFIFASIIIFIIGLVFAGFAKGLSGFAVAIIPTLAGYGLLMIMLNSAVRDFTPKDKAGLFQGIRMIFFVFIPMVLGPFIGNFVCRFSEIKYVNEYGVATSAPGAVMFIAAAIVAVFIFIPILALKKKGFVPKN
ncbi:MAG TPA: MFS transporter [Oscillospiraceae bacterium]|nr:MFS transporter [Oscillospiraceae bacterium]